MCRNATATVATLMAAIQPTLVSLLTILGIAATPDGQAAITAYDAALLAVQHWVPGTSAQDVIQVINAFTQIFDTLPIPADAKGLANIISAGVVIVISVLTGNSPAPAATTKEAHEKDTADKALKLVQTMIPGFHVSIKDRIEASLGDHSVAAKEYKNAWNAEAAKTPKYAALKVA